MYISSRPRTSEEKHVETIGITAEDLISILLETPVYSEMPVKKRRKCFNKYGLIGVQYVEVGRERSKKKWKAKVSVGGIIVKYTFHETKEQAAMAYDKMAREINGKDAITNF